MKAMILAAGEGRRMLPLTAHTPKPLLKVAGRPLIEYQIERLVSAGIDQIVINHAHLGWQLEQALGDGARLHARLQYSAEVKPLETAGGIIQALPLLGDQPFLVVNGDVWTDFPFARLSAQTLAPAQACLVMVDNAPHHPGGDFMLDSRGHLQFVSDHGGRVLTYSGIGLFHPAFFAGLEQGHRPLRPLLDNAIRQGRLLGQHFQGTWQDIGTPERLAQLDRLLRGH